MRTPGFGLRIIARLREMRVHQADLARHCGVCQQVVSNWCQHGSVPQSPERLEKICDFLSVTKKFLLEGPTEEIEPPAGTGQAFDVMELAFRTKIGDFLHVPVEKIQIAITIKT